MPWMEVSVMSLGQEFCELAGQPGNQMQELCQRFGISRKSGYKWLARYRADGTAGLVDQSRRPHTSPGKTSAHQEAVIVAAATDSDHLAWGPRKLHHWLTE